MTLRKRKLTPIPKSLHDELMLAAKQPRKFKPLLEKDIEEAVCDYAKELNMLCYKFTSPSRTAVPDRMFITLEGKVFFIEFKRPGEHATQPQVREHQRIQGHGVHVFVVDDIAYGKGVIKGMCE